MSPVESSVPCAKCGALIDGDAGRCPHCGVAFDGRAFQFAPREEPRPRRRFLPWVVLFVLFLLAMLAVAVFAPIGW